VLGQSNVMDAQSQFSKTVKQFFAGGFAGCVSRTVVAPIDRVKILMQTEKITSGGAEAKHTSIVQSLRTIVNEGAVAFEYCQHRQSGPILCVAVCKLRLIQIVDNGVQKPRMGCC